MENYVVSGLKEAVAHAINNNDWTPVRTLLKVTIAKDSVGYTQLHQIHVDDNIIEDACNGGFIELLSVFLNSGSPVNSVVCKSTGERMLHLAAFRGHLSLVKLLINVGADIDCEDCEGTTPVYYAVQGGNLEVAKYLINAGADINTCNAHGKTLLDAAYLYRTVTEEMLQLLLDSGCDPNKCQSYCPLYWEVRSNNIKHVKMLLDAGANVNSTGTDIPLHLAANWGFIPMMELLLEYGADINITDSGGNTALHTAVKKIQSVKFPKEHSSIINSLNSPFYPFRLYRLALPFQDKQFDVAMLLLNRGADLNLPIYNTVLHTAVRAIAPIHVIECLLEHGADVTAVDYNETALQCVISYRNLSNDWKLHIAKLLLIYGSNHHIKDDHDNTLLHWACEVVDVELVEYLIDYGLNVDAKNREGKKPIDIAHETGHPAIVNIIIENHCNKYSI